MRYEGYTGTVTTDDDGLVITREGLIARSRFGKDVAPRRVPSQYIAGVRFKTSSRLVNGWVQLVLVGQPAPELTVGSAASNAETVLFTYKHRDAFAQLHKWLQGVVMVNEDAGQSD